MAARKVDGRMTPSISGGIERIECPRCGAELHHGVRCDAHGWIWPNTAVKRRYVPEADVAALVEAVRGVRFYLHCELLDDPDKRSREARETGNEALADELYQRAMGQELAGESAVELAKALLPFAPDQKACSGCGRQHLYGSTAQEISDRHDASVEKWNREHPTEDAA